MQERPLESLVRHGDCEAGRILDAQVKWFNLAKGFGFVTPTDGTPDAFLPMAIVRRAGLHDLEEGTLLRCTVGPGAKGPLVFAVHAVLPPVPAAANPVPLARPHPVVPSRSPIAAPVQPISGANRPKAPSPAEPGDYIGKTVDATVKRYDNGKGFGFAALDGGRLDVFIHITALRRSGVSEINAGQRIRVSVIEGRRGLEAEYIDLV